MAERDRAVSIATHCCCVQCAFELRRMQRLRVDAKQTAISRHCERGVVIEERRELEYRGAIEFHFWDLDTCIGVTHLHARIEVARCDPLSVGRGHCSPHWAVRADDGCFRCAGERVVAFDGFLPCDCDHFTAIRHESWIAEAATRIVDFPENRACLSMEDGKCSASACDDARAVLRERDAAHFDRGAFRLPCPLHVAGVCVQACCRSALVAEDYPRCIRRCGECARKFRKRRCCAHGAFGFERVRIAIDESVHCVSEEPGARRIESNVGDVRIFTRSHECASSVATFDR